MKKTWLDKAFETLWATDLNTKAAIEYIQQQQKYDKLWHLQTTYPDTAIFKGCLALQLKMSNIRDLVFDDTHLKKLAHQIYFYIRQYLKNNPDILVFLENDILQPIYKELNLKLPNKALNLEEALFFSLMVALQDEALIEDSLKPNYFKISNLFTRTILSFIMDFINEKNQSGISENSNINLENLFSPIKKLEIADIIITLFIKIDFLEEIIKPY